MEEDFKLIKNKYFTHGNYKGLTYEEFLQLKENEVDAMCGQIENLRNRGKLRDVWEASNKKVEVVVLDDSEQEEEDEEEIELSIDEELAEAVASAAKSFEQKNCSKEDHQFAKSLEKRAFKIPHKMKCKATMILSKPAKTAPFRKQIREEFERLETIVEQGKRAIELWREEYKPFLQTPKGKRRKVQVSFAEP